ncbi:MAG: glycosyltransferase family 2 protein [Parabacteroides sp.]
MDVDAEKVLTIVIPFLNEGIEVRNTVADIRQWVGNTVEIIVINDCSNDGYDYEADLSGLNIQYVRNHHRIGAARSKDLGIHLSRTPFFLLLDAHMRFYDSSWAYKLVETLKRNDRQILCCQTKPLKKSGTRVFEPIASRNDRLKYGTFINLRKEPCILEPQWNFTEMDSATDTQPVPCIYGAAYCASKRYWYLLKGYEGLLGFGLEEAYISIKAYMEGGCCTLMKNIVTGHIYRTKFPYRVNGVEYIYNKFMIAELLLPNCLKQYIHDYYKRIMGKQYDDVKAVFNEQSIVIYRLKDYFRTIFSKSFDDFSQINKSVEDLYRGSETTLNNF